MLLLDQLISDISYHRGYLVAALSASSKEGRLNRKCVLLTKKIYIPYVG